VERALQLMMVSSEWQDEVRKNFEEGLSRKPGWKSLQQVQRWIFEG
jgi:hypothetical protein